MKRQVHVWMREDEYQALKQLAADADESVGNLVRRQLRLLIRERAEGIGHRIPAESASTRRGARS